MIEIQATDTRVADESLPAEDQNQVVQVARDATVTTTVIPTGAETPGLQETLVSQDPTATDRRGEIATDETEIATGARVKLLLRKRKRLRLRGSESINTGTWRPKGLNTYMVVFLNCWI